LVFQQAAGSLRVITPRQLDTEKRGLGSNGTKN